MSHTLMSGAPVTDNKRPPPDQVLQDIADYVHNYKIESPLAVSSVLLAQRARG